MQQLEKNSKRSDAVWEIWKNGSHTGQLISGESLQIKSFPQSYPPWDAIFLTFRTYSGAEINVFIETGQTATFTTSKASEIIDAYLKSITRCFTKRAV